MQDHRPINFEAVLVSDLIAAVAYIDSFFQAVQLKNRITDVYQQGGHLSKELYDNLNANVLRHSAQRNTLPLQEFVKGLNNIIDRYELVKKMSSILVEASEVPRSHMRRQ